MQNNKLALGVVTVAVALVAVLAIVFLDRNMSGPKAGQPQTYSFSGKVRSVESNVLVVESYVVIRDETGSNPDRVETRDRSVKVNSRTQVFRKTMSDNGQTNQELPLSDLGPGKEVVVYTDKEPQDGTETYAQSVEILR